MGVYISQGIPKNDLKTHKNIPNRAKLLNKKKVAELILDNLTKFN